MLKDRDKLGDYRRFDHRAENVLAHHRELSNSLRAGLESDRASVWLERREDRWFSEAHGTRLLDV